MGLFNPEYAPPGFGFSLEINEITSFKTSSPIEYLFSNF